MFSDKKDYNTLKLADFGLSIYSENDKETNNCGTLIYKSPEQINHHSYDHFVDYWATGYILFILCSGGCHPIYRQGMNTDDYINAFTHNIEYAFPPNFPK